MQLRLQSRCSGSADAVTVAAFWIAVVRQAWRRAGYQWTFAVIVFVPVASR
jgi:hypothetical protein